MAAEDRDRLVSQHLSLVQAIAAKLKRTLGRSIEFDDLVGYGTKGLLEAAERYDPTQGAAFSTFAYYRVRGAMLDGLRTMGWYSRSDYARYRAEERANEYLQNQAERAAAGQEASGGARPEKAAALESIAEVLGGIAVIHITSLEAAAKVADEKLPPPDADLERVQASARVRTAMAKLPEKERKLMELYYFGEKNLEEIGAVLGLSKSWACRLHARAVGLLRDALRDED